MKTTTLLTLLTLSTALVACNEKVQEKPEVVTIEAPVANPVPAKHADMAAAAKDGNAMAQFNMGVLYDQGAEVTENDVEALRWYKMAAEQDFPHAQLSVAEMYEKGFGVEKNYKTAMTYYKKAAASGLPYALNRIGHIYQEGVLVPRDNTEAYRWFKASAELGDMKGMTRLGAKYGNGHGVNQNLQLAYMWTLLASSQGDSEATTNLANIARVMEPELVEKSREMATKCLENKLKGCEKLINDLK